MSWCLRSPRGAAPTAIFANAGVWGHTPNYTATHAQNMRMLRSSQPALMGRVLVKHYGFTDEELDFIIDIHYNVANLLDSYEAPLMDAMLTKVTRNGQVTLPAAVRRNLHIEEGDYIEVTVQGTSVVLTPKKLIDKSQAYFWSLSWQAAERQASEDITAGRVREFADVEDLIASLDSERDPGQ